VEPTTTTAGPTTTTAEPTTTTTLICLPETSLCIADDQCCSGCCDENPTIGVPPNEYCVPAEFCACRQFGEECGLIVNGTFAAAGSPQLDCCDGLVCCEVGNDHVCAECCADWECPKGSICCAGVCREIECCIDDILIGLDPNDRCPEGCGCFEGLCVDKDQQHCVRCDDDKDCGDDTCCCHDGSCSSDCCRVCKQDHECPEDECCCRNGACSHHCCGEPGCKDDHDCAKGACCCGNGSCSHHCCDKPDDDTPEVDVLPNTGTGPDGDAAGWIAGAALAAGAAALLGSKIKQDSTPAEESDS
jgi:hypothetical protein